MVSNGYGEVAILECIARGIRALAPAARVDHLRLVGRAPEDAWPPTVGPQAQMPSGGLVTFWNFRNIWRDLRAGLAVTTLRQFAFLARHRRAYDIAVAVGDVFCLAACRLFARLPTVFVATAKSEYVAPHSGLEAAIARGAKVVFARDAATAAALAARGVDARFAGNVMMDDVAPTGAPLPLDASALRVAVLPGSRDDAPSNAAVAVRRLAAIAAAAPRPVQALFALAPAVDAEAVTDAVRHEGMPLERASARAGAIARGRRGPLEVVMVRQAFGDVLGAAEIVLGQAGTGNEQAAGMGKPVIAAAEPGRTPDRVGWYRMRQKRLLGDALLVLPDDDDAFARGVLALVADPARMSAMGDAGRERMGGAGAAATIARTVLDVARRDR